MADIARLLYYLLDMFWPLVELFRESPNVFVNGNVFIYYRDGNEVKAVAPDLMVSFDVDADGIRASVSYHLWAVGKPPELVMEIGSKSTYNRDLTEKRDIYAKMGVPQYWLLDPPDGSNYGFILKGLRLVDGEYEEIPMTEGSGDFLRGHSEVCGLGPLLGERNPSLLQPRNRRIPEKPARNHSRPSRRPSRARRRPSRARRRPSRKSPPPRPTRRARPMTAPPPCHSPKPLTSP